jgi:peptide chain release factor 2
MDKEAKQKQLEQMEADMMSADFWNDKEKAQKTIRDIQTLKDEIAGVGKFDRGDAIMTIFSGAGGDDSEDFSAILLQMYMKYFQKRNWEITLLHENQNDHGGYRNVTIEISGKDVYGTLKHESGVHRLVRISPFNAKQLRHTSFSLVEVIPKFEKTGEIDIPESDIRVELSKSGGPGGQNVNKRETAVRVIHVPTNLSAHVTSERSQAQNKEKAIAILTGKLYKKMEEDRIAQEKGMYVSKTTQIEWGNQIRSYVMHPYKMVKDHRTNAETANIDAVLEGDIEEFLEAEKNL